MSEWQDVQARLAAFTEELRIYLGDAATVTRDGPTEDYTAQTTVTPHRAGALDVSWAEFGYGDTGEVSLTAGHIGGWFEMDGTMVNADDVEDIVRAVVAGRVVEVFGPGRSRVEVVVSNGEVWRETGGVAPKGCLPIPGWVRRGRRVEYLPYVNNS